MPKRTITENELVSPDVFDASRDCEGVRLTGATPEWESAILGFADLLLHRFGLAELDWTVKLFDWDEHNFGKCWDGPRIITLTRDHVLGTDVRNVRELLLHEMAHALTSVRHDQEWYDQLMQMGAEGVWRDEHGDDSYARVTD